MHCKRTIINLIPFLCYHGHITTMLWKMADVFFWKIMTFIVIFSIPVHTWPTWPNSIIMNRVQMYFNEVEIIRQYYTELTDWQTCHFTHSYNSSFIHVFKTFKLHVNVHVGEKLFFLVLIFFLSFFFQTHVKPCGLKSITTPCQPPVSGSSIF